MKDNSENKDQFLRIGTQIYLKEITPSGKEQLIPWSSNAIYQDYGKDRTAEILKSMPKYVGWINEPSHTDYQPVIGRWMNLYQPLPYEPRPGVDIPNTRQFLQHIFGEHYELGLDYLQLLYNEPKQKLPILLLVSKERNTGKSTFLKFLKAIFGANATYNTNENFKSQFNSDWANKLLIMIDEAFFDKLEYTERLKNLNTAETYKLEAKGKDPGEIDFHGKFVLCSNNLDRPLIIEPGETRFWVIKVPKLLHDDTMMKEKLMYEIPAFLDFLLHRQLSTECTSRMWFDFRDYHTSALDRIIASNRGRLEQQIADLLMDIVTNCNLDVIQFCVKDVLDLLQVKGYQGRNNIDENSIRRVLRYTWELEPVKNGLTYQRYTYAPERSDGYFVIQSVGRYFTMTRERLQKLTFSN